MRSIFALVEFDDFARAVPELLLVFDDLSPPLSCVLNSESDFDLAKSSVDDRALVSEFHAHESLLEFVFIGGIKVVQPEIDDTKNNGSSIIFLKAGSGVNIVFVMSFSKSSGQYCAGEISLLVQYIPDLHEQHRRVRSYSWSLQQCHDSDVS